MNGKQSGYCHASLFWYALVGKNEDKAPLKIVLVKKDIAHFMPKVCRLPLKGGPIFQSASEHGKTLIS